MALLTCLWPEGPAASSGAPSFLGPGRSSSCRSFTYIAGGGFCEQILLGPSQQDTFILLSHVRVSGTSQHAHEASHSRHQAIITHFTAPIGSLICKSSYSMLKTAKCPGKESPCLLILRSSCQVLIYIFAFILIIPILPKVQQLLVGLLQILVEIGVLILQGLQLGLVGGNVRLVLLVLRLDWICFHVTCTAPSSPFRKVLVGNSCG